MNKNENKKMDRLNPDDESPERLCPWERFATYLDLLSLHKIGDDPRLSPYEVDVINESIDEHEDFFQEYGVIDSSTTTNIESIKKGKQIIHRIVCRVLVCNLIITLYMF